MKSLLVLVTFVLLASGVAPAASPEQDWAGLQTFSLTQQDRQ